MKCLCTFGKKVSEAQIRLIKKTNVKKIILLHDGRDAINEMKKNSFKLKEHGFKVEVGYMPDKDPADSTQQELIDVFSNLLTPEEFWLNKLQIR
jgi:DNA primase